VSSEIINITRAELYEKVWTTPIQKLAREFSLSDHFGRQLALIGHQQRANSGL